MAGHLHYSLAVQSQEPTAKLLELYRGQGQRPPFAGWFPLNLAHFGGPCGQAPLEQDYHRSTIEETVAVPTKVDAHAIALMHDLDAPELLGHKVLHPEIAVHDEAQGGKLTRAYRECQQSWGARVRGLVMA
jgi:hypothetical protein